MPVSAPGHTHYGPNTSMLRALLNDAQGNLFNGGADAYAKSGRTENAARAQQCWRRRIHPGRCAAGGHRGRRQGRYV